MTVDDEQDNITNDEYEENTTMIVGNYYYCVAR